MKLVVDSSSFAKRYVQEVGSDKLDRLLESASELAFCVILVPEIVYGLNRRLSERVLTISDYRIVKKNCWMKSVGDNVHKRVNNPSPEGPALISPQRGGVYLKSSNGIFLWHNKLTLTWPRGPGFQNWNK